MPALNRGHRESVRAEDLVRSWKEAYVPSLNKSMTEAYQSAYVYHSSWQPVNPCSFTLRMGSSPYQIGRSNSVAIRLRIASPHPHNQARDSSYRHPHTNSMNARSPRRSTQRSWIFDDAGDDELPLQKYKLPSTPQTPQSLYVSVSTEKFGEFLTLSDPARNKALELQQKQTDADSARQTRRRSIFESVKSVILDSTDVLPPLTTASSTNTSVSSHDQREKQVNLRQPEQTSPRDYDSPKVRYKRRGSCTKFSLEAEMLQPDSDGEYDEEEEQKFKSFRKGETLQCDNVYAQDDASEHGESQRSGSRSSSRRLRSASPALERRGMKLKQAPLTIDQMPVPLKGSQHRRGSARGSPPVQRSVISTVPRSASPAPSGNNDRRSRSLDRRQEDAKQHRAWMPKLRHVSLSSPARSSKPSRPSQGGSSKHSKKDTKPRRLPPAPFTGDSSHKRTSMSDHPRVDTDTTVNKSLPASEHQRGRKNSRHEKSSAPKFGSLLKRLHLQRQDSGRSFAEDDTFETSCTLSNNTEAPSKRVQRRFSLSSKEQIDQEDHAALEATPAKNRRRLSINSSNHSRCSQSPVARSRSKGSAPSVEESPATHKRQSWHPLKRRDPTDVGDSPVVHNKKLVLPPPPPIASSPSALRSPLMGHPTGDTKRPPLTPRHAAPESNHRRYDMTGQIVSCEESPVRQQRRGSNVY